MLTDEKLVEASLQGSDDAFNELLGRYQERLLRFLLTRSASQADAEDAMQDAFISAYRYLHSYNPRWRFSTWLYRIALRNLAAQQQPQAVVVDSVAVAANDPLQDCLAAAERENIWTTAKRLLSDDGFNALWLRYVEEMSVREVATALNRSLSWTKVTLFRGRRRLKAELVTSVSAVTRSENYG